MLHNYEESQTYLEKHPQLASEETARHLFDWCIDQEMSDNYSRMERIAHQMMVIEFILVLMKFSKEDVFQCITAFFYTNDR